MQTMLKEIGVEEIDCVGKEFNPELHYGVAKIEDEQLGENVVADCMQKGYIYKNKVIRHSMVKVAN
jgi:molecular chaperone GrpE